MSVIVQRIIKDNLVNNTAIVTPHKAKAKAWCDAQEEGNTMDVGLARDIAFLMEVGIVTEDALPADSDAMKALLKAHLKVVRRGKRFFVFSLNGVVMVANRFGVITYNTVSEILAKEGFASLQLVRLEPEMRELSGAIADGYDKMDRVYNYSVPAIAA